MDCWICPPGESYATALGLYYLVRSSRDIDWIFQRNIQFLEDYLRVIGISGEKTRRARAGVRWVGPRDFPGRVITQRQQPPPATIFI